MDQADAVFIATRLERLEAIVVLLCEQASRGQGSMGKPFWDFMDAWRREHAAAPIGSDSNRAPDASAE